MEEYQGGGEGGVILWIQARASASDLSPVKQGSLCRITCCPSAYQACQAEVAQVRRNRRDQRAALFLPRYAVFVLCDPMNGAVMFTERGSAAAGMSGGARDDLVRGRTWTAGQRRRAV